ncbi:MAG: leucyl aminopeptidase [Bryobacteraceae bacterium]|nr:leucyl aminopeptidase [Bryobacteraceae bacterium]
MDIAIQQGQIGEFASPVLVIPGFDPDTPRDHEVDYASGGLINDLYKSGEFRGKVGDTAVLHRVPGFRAERLMLAGGGKRADFTPFEMRRLAGAAVRAAATRRIPTVQFWVPAEFAEPQWVQAVVEGALAGSWEPDVLKTDPRKHETRVTSFTVCVASSTAALEKVVADATVIGESQNFARDLVNLPANLLTPLELAARAKQMAQESGLTCEVLETEQMRELGMGALLGVAQGSENPPALIVIRYEPPRAVSDDHLALVGKGVTFDTGGYSIKPADGMEKMKYDMGGAAAVLGAMRAIARLKPDVRVTAYIPTVENMISGNAQRPGDIVTTMCGKTVEVLNTDAEGRLILADAMSYALKDGATHMVDAATLTGAIAVALGHLYFGAFTNNDALYDRVAAASKSAGERVWRLPMDEEYKDYLKSAFADLPNIGGRWGGSITAAKFLEEFAGEKPWVHLDIAGTAWLDDGKAWLAKGPTGTAVRTFIGLATGWSA